MSEPTWYVRSKGQKRGPFTREKLLIMYRQGRIAAFDEASEGGEWFKISALVQDAPPEPAGPPPIVRGSAPAPTSPDPPPAEGSNKWPTVSDPDLETVSGERVSGKGKRIRRAALLTIPLLLIAVSVTAATYFWKKGTIVLPGSTSAIRDLGNEDEVASAVGLVVVGFEHALPDGTHGVSVVSTGSCAAVTPDGYMLTNRHVVEFYDRFSNAADLPARKVNYIAKIVSQVPAPQRGEAINRITANTDIMRYNKLDPKLWIITKGRNGRPVTHTAKIVHMCDPTEYDFAILKIDRAAGSYFRISHDAKKKKRGEEMIALGFPGATQELGSEAEKIEDSLRQSRATRVDSFFKEQDLDYVRTMGHVSVDRTEKGGVRWIQHDAPITHGNSGGPLVNSGAVIVGLNTLGVQDGSTYRAVSIAQLKSLIQEHVKNAEFVDD